MLPLLWRFAPLRYVERPDKPCIGEIETYDMADVCRLVRGYRKKLLRIVCSNNVSRVERALATDAHKFSIYVNYSVGLEFFRKHPDFQGSFDPMNGLAGCNAYYDRREIEAMIRSLRPDEFRPYGISEDDNARILEESDGVCWLCGKHDPGNLSVQEIIPQGTPYFAASRVHKDCFWIDGNLHLCKALCGDCMRAWRRVFDECEGKRRWDWVQGHGIVNFDKLVQCGMYFDGCDEALESLRRACREMIGVAPRMGRENGND